MRMNLRFSNWELCFIYLGNLILLSEFFHDSPNTACIDKAIRYHTFSLSERVDVYVRVELGPPLLNANNTELDKSGALHGYRWLHSKCCKAGLIVSSKGDGSCTYPSDLQSSVWYDSNKGQLTYTTNTMTGYTYSSYNSGSSIWTCFLIDGNYIVSKANSPIDVFGTHFDAYLCQLVTQITTYSYSYYIEGDNQANANGERMNIFITGTSVTLSQACTKTNAIPTEEFHVLVKSTNMADVKQYFPTPLLGTFEYTKVTSAGVSSCGTGSVWDACANRTTMTFNMTQCNSVVAFSQGEVYGVTSVTKDSTYYVIVVNPSTVDDSTYYRFTCMAVTQSGSTVTVVEKSGSCGVGQNTTLAGTGGSKYTMNPYVTCPFTTDSSSSTAAESSSNTGLIAGIVVALLVLIIIALVVGLVIYKKKQKQIHTYDKGKETNGNELDYLHRGYTNVPENPTSTAVSSSQN